MMTKNGNFSAADVPTFTWLDFEQKSVCRCACSVSVSFVHKRGDMHYNGNAERENCAFLILSAVTILSPNLPTLSKCSVQKNTVANSPFQDKHFRFVQTTCNTARCKYRELHDIPCTDQMSALHTSWNAHPWKCKLLSFHNIEINTVMLRDPLKTHCFNFLSLGKNKNSVFHQTS